MEAAHLIDPQRTWVIIGGDYGIVPSGRDGWRDLGECIGSHENLQKLEFNAINIPHENFEALLTGVAKNRTVRELKFNGCHGEWPLGILEIFFRDNQNLSLLQVHGCRGGFINSLSAVVRGCTSRSLQHIDCSGDQEHQVEHDEIAELIEALAGLPQLKKLEFGSCHVGHRECGVMAALLRSPACVLENIRLCRCSIGNEGLAVLLPAVAAGSTLTELSLLGMGCSTAVLQSFSGVLRSPTCALKNLYLLGNNIRDDAFISFAGALGANHRLEKLHIGNRHSVSDIGFAAMTRALCDTFSIADVHASNHTLRYLGFYEMPNDLRTYLCMNEREDKSLVAREKIFMHFFEGNFSLEPFHENAMAPNVLPHLLAWIGRTPDGESFTALFNFLKRMPSLCGNFCPAIRHSGRKRKVGN